MRRLLVLVIGLLTAWFGIASPSAAIVGPTMPQVTYTYDSNPIAAQLDDPATERGPPVTYDCASALNAADRWSRGASARQRGGTPRGTTTHPTPVSPAWDIGRTATTQALARGVDGDRSSAAPIHVAANTGTRSIDDLLRPGGLTIGKGGHRRHNSRDHRRTRRSPDDVPATQPRRHDRLSDPEMTRVELPNGGGFVQLRTVMTRSPNTAATIDVNIPGLDITKLKYNP